MTKKCVEWLNNNRNTTPRLVYDLEKVKENFSQFVKLFGVIKPYYPVKANPSVKIIALLKFVLLVPSLYNTSLHYMDLAGKI